MENERPTLMTAAGWMALPIGFMWSASFFCTIYGTNLPLLSMMGTAIALISIFILFRQLTNYRRLYPSTWLHILCLSFVTCLLAGLLTDAAQYAYFLFVDKGRLFSQMSEAMKSEEYRDAWQKFQEMMPGRKLELEEMQEMMQNLSIRDLMTQLIFMNAIMALPVSLIAALPVRPASPTSSQGDGKVENKE